ncbi:hyaluronidase PH-20 [Carlito syrichta]|uniref:Hyaluronidase n=1 Tax=Carlito syrichta TaxID=1868482 RepID=A0A1U7T5D5_CARSF|nr:hyaluronidase PH-20 [Carlito syrichta]
MRVLIFKHIFFGNFVDFNRGFQTVFIFLLIPCCLTQNFSAPPVIRDVPFLWAWNAPTEFCLGKFGDPLDMSLFSLMGSPRQNVTDQRVTIFYVDRLGLYPFLEPGTHANVNGGIPQNGSLKDHLVKAEKDISYYIPTDKLGLAVIDWEEWRPTWARNWKPKDIYRNRSIVLVQQQNAHLNLTEATDIARREFEKAGKDFMLETLKLGKSLRPNQLWGYYLFPDCYNHNYNKPGFNGSCSYIEKKRNDELDWLWKESTALYPSIYLNTRQTPQQAMLFVRNRVQEAIRMAKLPDANNPLPVFVYTRLVFTDRVLNFLSQEDLVNTFGETIALGASGIVIWGSLTLMRSMKSCLLLDDYMQTIVNPYIINVTLAAKMCSQVLCQEQGICIRKHWNSNDYLHLNPKNFDIQIGKSGKFTVLGKPSIDDLQQFSQKFSCSCYTNLNCKAISNVQNITFIDVCIADNICIDTFLHPDPNEPFRWIESSSTSYNISSSPASVTVHVVNVLFLTMSSAVVNL